MTPPLDQQGKVLRQQVDSFPTTVRPRSQTQQGVVLCGPRTNMAHERELHMTLKTYPFTLDDAEWRRILTPEQYYVMRAHGTEMPGTCALSTLR